MSKFTTNSIAMEMLMSGLIHQPGNMYTNIVMEYYSGKTKELLKCESYLQKIIDNILANKDKMTKTSIITKDSPLNKKLEEELASFFGVKEVNIHWSVGVLNAYTLTPSIFFTNGYKNALETGKTSSLKMHICVYEDIITDANLNSSELMAVLLHEIGHNFYYCPIMAGAELFYTIMSLGLPILSTFLTKVLYHSKWAIDDFVKKTLPMVYSAYANIKSFMNDINRFIAPIQTAQIVAKLLSGSAMIVMRNPVTNLLKYGAEEGADSFAARYGYGPEQTSALAKMSNVENSHYGKALKSGGTGMSVYHDFNQLSLDIICMCAVDPHPNASQRASSMLKKLKRDLASGKYPEGMTKDLEKEIDRMEKMYNVAAKNSAESNVQVRQSWYDAINIITDGNSDFREIFGFYFKTNQF